MQKTDYFGHRRAAASAQELLLRQREHAEFEHGVKHTTQQRRRQQQRSWQFQQRRRGDQAGQPRLLARYVVARLRNG